MSSLKLWTLLLVCLILLIPISASAEESCNGINKGQKIWWDGVELKPGQIGRLTVARDTYLYKPEGEFKVTARVLKAGEKYRIYAFKPGMLSVGGGLYVDRDAKVKYETPSKGKLSNLKCANPDWYKPAPSPVKPPNDETEEETPSPKPQEPAEPMTWKLEYKGKQNVSDRELAPYDLKNLNTYELKFETGYPIKIYVTDDYINRFGEGYAYEEIGEMMASLSEVRKMKPFEDMKSSLRFYFYTNESQTSLPKDSQAFAGYQDNRNQGRDYYIVMNGSTMPYDFRATLQHEIYHYFDQNTYIGHHQYQNVFQNYWGPDYRFWLMEGAAEYSCYFLHSYPENTKNGLRKQMVQPAKESIIAYAKQQGGNEKDLLWENELNSFDDIMNASGNNYGITLSLFWYLTEMYGYENIYQYVEDVKNTFWHQSAISQIEKDKMAKKHFGKTEKDVLNDWVQYFDTFNGELKKRFDIKTGTVNHIMNIDDPLLPDNIRQELEGGTSSGKLFVVNLKEWNPDYNYKQMHEFRNKATWEFELRAPGELSVKAQLTGGFFSDSVLTNGDVLNAWSIAIPPEEASKLQSGIAYTLHVDNNNSGFEWVISEELTITFK